MVPTKKTTVKSSASVATRVKPRVVTIKTSSAPKVISKPAASLSTVPASNTRLKQSLLVLKKRKIK